MKKFASVILLITMLLTSIGFNCYQFRTIGQLQYKVQKFEAGPWKGLLNSKPIFPRPKKEEPKIKDLDINTTITIWGRKGIDWI